MSDVQRFDVGMGYAYEADGGKFVEYEDYAEAASTIARLEHALLTERGKLERADEVAQGLMAERDALRNLIDDAARALGHGYSIMPQSNLHDQFRAALAPAAPKEGTP